MRARRDERTFSLHEKSDWNVAAVGLGLLVVVETVPVHFLVAARSPMLAWTLTMTSAYALLWLIGDAIALKLRPCVLEQDTLLIRVGLRWSVRVPRAVIASLTPVRGEAPSRRARGYLRATVFVDPTRILELSAPVTALGPYGIRREVTRIGLSPDEPDRLAAALGLA